MVLGNSLAILSHPVGHFVSTGVLRDVCHDNGRKA